MRSKWEDTAGMFDLLASEYDAWFENNPLFNVELTALKAVEQNLPHPRFEIGVGPGRFAEALNIEFGLDPATTPLQLAGARSILGIMGVGENLPVLSGCMGTVFMIFSFCFLDDPTEAVRECARILTPGGRLVIGMIPGRSPWGKRIERKKKENNPFYRQARLKSIGDVVEILSESGFTVIESWSTLLQPPGSRPRDESPRQGKDEMAGFCVLVSHKKEGPGEDPESYHPDH